MIDLYLGELAQRLADDAQRSALARLQRARYAGAPADGLATQLQAAFQRGIAWLPAASPQQRQALMASSLVAGVYEKVVDRESAYEKLKGRAQDAATQAAVNGKADPTGAAADGDGGGLMGGLNDVLFGSTGPRGGKRDGLAQTMAKSAVRTMGTTIGKEILRGVLGGIFGGGSKRR